MDMIYFKDQDGTELGLPLDRLVFLRFTPENDDGEEELTVFFEGVGEEEEYEVLGKDARKALEEIKIQIKNINSSKTKELP